MSSLPFYFIQFVFYFRVLQKMAGESTAVAEEKKAFPLAKVLALTVLLGAVVYVIYDQITQGCTLTEKEMDRAFRITCGGGNSTEFTCNTPGAITLIVPSLLLFIIRISFLIHVTHCRLAPLITRCNHSHSPFSSLLYNPLLL